MTLVCGGALLISVWEVGAFWTILMETESWEVGNVWLFDVCRVESVRRDAASGREDVPFSYFVSCRFNCDIQSVTMVCEGTRRPRTAAANAAGR